LPWAFPLIALNLSFEIILTKSNYFLNKNIKIVIKYTICNFFKRCLEKKYPHENFNYRVEEFEMEDHFPPRNFI